MNLQQIQENIKRNSFKSLEEASLFADRRLKELIKEMNEGQERARKSKVKYA